MKIQKKQEIEFFGTKTGNANSIALGYATETKNFGEVAVGVMNKSTAAKDPNSSKGVCVDPDATLFSVGCGGSGERKNALEVKGDGSVIIPGENGNINIADKIKQAFDTDASIELVKSAEDSLQYTLMVNNESRGSINIPKDQFLKNVTYDSEGKQLVFTFITLDEDEHVERVPVGDLKDIYTAGEGITINGDNVISADFSSVMTAISDEKTLRETTDNEIKSTLDTKADLDESGYVEIEQLTPAVIYDKETNSINGVFEVETLYMLDIVENVDEPDNGWQYYNFDDLLDDDVVPQYIYDATANEHIEITATTYLDDYACDAFNTAKPLDLTHDLYLDNEQTGKIKTIRRLKVDKLVSDSILINEGVYDVTNEITNNIVVSTARQLISGDVNFNHNIILNASNNGKIKDSKNGILISTDDNTNIISDSIVIGSNNTRLSTGKSCILIGNIKNHSESNEINIGQKNTSASDGIIVGNSSQVGNKSVCIGNTNKTNKAYNVTCIGNSINVDDNYDYAIVIGQRASAINSNKYDETYRLNGAIAIGLDAKVENAANIAIGFGANSKASKCIAIGLKAVANANYSVSLNSKNTNQMVGGVYLGAFTKDNKNMQFAVGGYKDNSTFYNIEETLSYSNQHKKYIYGIGGYDGTNSATEGIKSLQEVLADKADASAIPTKLSQLTNDSFPTPNDVAIFAGLSVNNNAKIKYIQKTGGDEGTYLTAETPADRVSNKVYAGDGSLFDVSKLVKRVQCNVSGDPNNIEFGYTTVDNTYNFSVIPTVTTNHSGIMTAADKVKLDKLQELVELKIVGTSESSVAMKPNKVYEITVGSALTITLEEPTDKTVYNEYQGTFDTGDTIPTVTFPSNVRWNDTPKLGANQHVEFSIKYSGGKYYGICQVWDMTKLQSV